MRGSKQIICALTAVLVASMGAVGVAAPAAAAVEVVTFRAQATSASTLATQRVTVPAAVEAGDGMLLFATTNTLVDVTSAPGGWTLVGTRQSSTDTRTYLYKKVAAAADAGTSQAITYAATTKGTLVLLAYDGTAADPVEVFASAGETSNRTTHTTPGITVPTDGSMVVSYWADKSSSTTGWTLPGGQVQRALALGTGSGRITSVASDFGTPSSAGASPAQTATVIGTGSGKATMWTVVLKAAEATPPANVAPVASFTTACTQLTCTVDGSGSTDTAPGAVASYAWSFGDGSTGTGRTASHTYATAGAYTITLIVTDDQGLPSAPTTRTVNPSSGPPTSDEIAFRASTEAVFTGTTARVTIPATVRETDGMLLFATTNTLGVSVTAPPEGWTLEGSRLDTDTLTTVYSKVATDNDAGRNVAVGFSATTKSTLTLLAYDGTAADPTAVVASAAESTFRATHTTPGANVASAGSWVVSYWADKSSGTTGWTLPAGQTQRSLALGTGPGRITSVASDQNAVSPVGASPGRTATADASSGKATMWTVVLQSDETSAPNVAPVASFTLSCPTATCTVDASGSTDTAPGTIAEYAWDFGDGTTGTGVSTTHTYTTSGAKTITLVVTDNQGLASAPATRTANVTVGGGVGNQPVPGHTRLVPDQPRTNTPRISNGEIWDIEVVPQLNRVFIAGSFTSLANTVSPTTTVNQAFLASYNLTTGLIDTQFRPTFGGGGVNAVEASPDGTKLFVGGSFNTVNGVAKQKVASLNLTTGAPLTSFGFTNSTNNQVQSLAATNSTVYVGGRFSRINGVLKTGLAAVNAASGAVDESFDNNLAGGIGVNGQLGVPQLKLTHDNRLLLVVHTGRQIDGQDRLGMGIIDTATRELLPFRSRLWDLNLGRVGGVTRICCADIAPDDSYFVVSSGSGGDAPPISDTAVRYNLDAASLQNDDVQPAWISRHFDSIYSVAITEQAVYLGGHFQFIESPDSCPTEPCFPGLENVGYGTGQGLAGYGLGDAVVRRDHLAAVSPANGRALEWYSVSNSFEGDKAMEATSRGLFVGGDGMFKGGVRTGRVGFYDFSTETFPAPAPDTTILTPIEGRVVVGNEPFQITGTARVASGTVGRVQVQIQDRDSGQWLQDNGTAFTTTFSSTNNSLNATLGAGSGTTRSWSIPATIATSRNLRVYAQAFTSPTGGTGDSTKAEKWFESFSTADQTPTTSITGPSGTQTSTTFTVTGTANDDHGVNSLTFWFRDDQNRYLQADGTVDSIFNSFRGVPDVIGATNATWSYEVTLPHEGNWRGSATAIDTIGQADLRSGVRDWRIDSTVVAPTVAISQPVEMTPPFAAPTVTVAPGSRVTFSGIAEDDQGLRNVEVTLRNSSTGEGLASDCSFIAGGNGTCRVSPVDISGSVYNWTYTTPFDLTPGTYTFTVRATDDEDNTTSSSNRGQLTINASYPGDNPPGTTMAFVAPLDGSLTVNLAGTATDEIGVKEVRVTLQERDTGRYLQANGTMSATPAYRLATLGTPLGTSTTWSLPPITLPSGGDWRFSATAYDTRDQFDASPATGTYTLYPGDGPPSLSDTLGQPQTGASFDAGKIVVTGRAEDSPDQYASIASVQVGVVNAAGQWMSSSGTFTSTTPSYRTAFLNSPGSAGSNYSYTTPVIPAGVYTVRVRPVDVHNQIGAERISTDITVTQPSNLPPVPIFSYTCNQNVCTFDGRASTDENASSLTFTWSFGTSSGTTVNGSGPLPIRTFTAPSPVGAPFQVTLTVRDEWQVSATSAPQSVTIVEPSGNQPPVPTFTVSCQGLTCAVNSSGTADPNTGDSVSYSWNWGDGTAASTGANPSAHAYAAPGSYTVTLTTTDGWGDSASTSRSVSLAEPPGNTAPTAAFTSSCVAYTTCTFSSADTADAQGDVIRYAWNFGDTGTSTSANPSRTYAAPGTYTVTLTATDVWGKSSTVSHDVTMTEPAGNSGPNATFVATCTTLTCAMNSTGTVDPEGHTIKGYSWNWGDGTANSTGASPSHTYTTPGTYTITLTVTDSWNRAGAPTSREVTMTEPAGNQGPTAVFPAPTCTATNTTCAFTSTGSADPENNTPLRYLWVWGDGTPDSTSSSSSHAFPVAGTYTVTLTVTDAWGRAGAPVTRQVTTSPEPAGNTGPTITFPQPVCTGLSCAVSSSGTTDPHGVRGYSWDWGDGTATSTSASPSPHVYAVAGTYTITLTVTDNWGRASVATRTVTVA